MPNKKFMIRWSLFLLLVAALAAFYGYGLSGLYHPSASSAEALDPTTKYQADAG